MAEVTVEQLAKTVGTDPDKLLSQMKDAGLPHKKADEGVSDDDKRTLLAHLKRSHGSDEAAPRKITLKRKSVSTLKTGGSAGKRTVNVEVRKKRTYVKRPEVEEAADTEVTDLTAAEVAATEAVPAADASTEIDGSISPAQTSDLEAAQGAEEEAPIPVAAEEAVEDLSNLDPEVLRQRAAERRRSE